MKSDPIRLTQYSHGAGLRLQIAPDVLSRILADTAEQLKQARFHRYCGDQEMTPRRSFSMTNAPCSLPRTFLCPSLMTLRFWTHRGNKRHIRHLRDGGRASSRAIRGWPVDQLAPEIATSSSRSRCLRRTGFPIGRRAQHRRTRAPWSRCHRPRGESSSETKRCF